MKSLHEYINSVKSIMASEHGVRLYLWRCTPIKYFISDIKMISFLYESRFNKRINLSCPQTFNEKLLWLTLYDRRPIYNNMVDKYEAKKWIKEILVSKGISTKCIIPTLAIYNRFDEINWDALPNSFVIKTVHDSGGVVVVQNKGELDREYARKKIEKSLNNNYYWYSREWAYKDVRPRIIIEKKLKTVEPVPMDYKIFCFNGKCKLWFLAQDRANEVKFDFFDMNWNKLPITQGHKHSLNVVSKPSCWEEMCSIAEIISSGFPFLRVDFYVDENGQFYIGELTLTHFGGLVPFEPNEWDLIMGNYLQINS